MLLSRPALTAREAVLYRVNQLISFTQTKRRPLSFLVMLALGVVATAFFVLLSVSLITSRNSASSQAAAIAAWHNGTLGPASASLADKAYNETLGFGEVVYLSMPQRTDRQDAMTLLGSMYNIKFTKVDGVDGNTIVDKAIPDNDWGHLRPSEYGCWRAHADAWSRFLQSGLETALILEDDVDFDVHIHDIFRRMSMQMQRNPIRVEPPTLHEKSTAPYGLDWDMIYVGHCSDYSNKDRRDLAIVFDDPAAPPRSNMIGSFIGQLEEFGVRGSDIGKKRVVAPSFGPVCTAGYAITRRGAQRLLLNFSYLGLDAAIDIDILRKLQAGKLRGYTVTPNVFAPWRVDGLKDSDNIGTERNISFNGLGNRGGYSKNLRDSARQQMVLDLDLDNWSDFERVLPKHQSSS
ncbi:hypothetical protein V1512DRAFT_262819 [Lipomyces arxii]|uniref:uncharacterized protein n=1 Tax=Lipomyces arxii TaxID=56418 RepID=UPI0034CE7FEF